MPYYVGPPPIRAGSRSFGKPSISRGIIWRFRGLSGPDWSSGHVGFYWVENSESRVESSGFRVGMTQLCSVPPTKNCKPSQEDCGQDFSLDTDPWP